MMSTNFIIYGGIRNMKTALITGTSSGIGLAISQKLIENNWRVIGISRTDTPIIHNSFINFKIDLTRISDTEMLIRQLLKEYSFDFGPFLRHSTTSTLQLIASGLNHDGSSAMREATVSTTQLTLTLDPDFSNTRTFDADEVIFAVTAEGKIDKKMEVRFDGELIPSLSKTLGPN